MSKVVNVYRLMQTLSEELGKDIPLSYALTLMRIAMAGSEGVDLGQMRNELEASAGAMSRTVQTLGDQHYLKDKPGYGLVERSFGAKDNRLRIVKLTPKGEKFVAKLMALMK